MICIKVANDGSWDREESLRSMTMPVRVLVSPPAIEQGALHATVGAILLWSGVLIRELPQIATGGALCGEPQALFGHCPLCFPAAALTGLAAALLTATFRAPTRREAA